jgi:hypothetical protein
VYGLSLAIPIIGYALHRTYFSIFIIELQMKSSSIKVDLMYAGDGVMCNAIKVLRGACPVNILAHWSTVRAAVQSKGKTKR